MKNAGVTIACVGCGKVVPIHPSSAGRKWCSRACYVDLSKKYRVDPNTGCWIWLASKDEKGYGNIWQDGTRSRAHRVLYEKLVGPVPDGLQLDHLCQNKSCVNPAHLEPVTNRENSLRTPRVIAAKAATRCKHGHELTTENTYVHPSSGSRICRKCTAFAQSTYAKRKGA